MNLSIGLRLLSAVALAAASLSAQAPHISSIVNSADFSAGVPLGGFGTVYGTGLSDAVYQPSTYPFPISLGPTEAALCTTLVKTLSINSACLPLALTYVSPTQINFVMPLALPPPSTGLGLTSMAVVVAVGATVDDGASSGTNHGQTFAGTVDPRLFVEGYDCSIDSRFPNANKNCGLSWAAPSPDPAYRGAITDLTGNLITSANPAHLNQYLVAWVSGMGEISRPNTAVWLDNIPMYGSTSSSSEPITPQYSGESSFPGLYQVNIQVPAFIATGFPGYYPPWPCGNYSWEVSLSIGTANNVQSNLVQIPVVVKSGDAPCSP